MHWKRLLISSGIAGLMAGFGALQTAGDYTKQTLIGSAITAFVVALKDVQAQFAQTPKKASNDT